MMDCDGTLHAKLEITLTYWLLGTTTTLSLLLYSVTSLCTSSIYSVNFVASCYKVLPLALIVDPFLVLQLTRPYIATEHRGMIIYHYVTDNSKHRHQTS